MKRRQDVRLEVGAETMADGQPDFWRQLDFVTPRDLAFPITIIGAGGIGSPTALLLAKMGCSNLRLIDFDLVEDHNFPNQMFRLEDLGRPKAEALAEIVRAFTGVEPQASVERYEDQALQGVVIVCVDNMATRQKVWQRVRLNIRVPLLIDARMGGEIAQVFALNPCLPQELRGYEELLHTDEESAEVPCTAQAIIYNTFMIASVIGKIMKAHARKEPLPMEGIVKLVDVQTLHFY